MTPSQADRLRHLFAAAAQEPLALTSAEARQLLLTAPPPAPPRPSRTPTEGGFRHRTAHFFSSPLTHFSKHLLLMSTLLTSLLAVLTGAYFLLLSPPTPGARSGMVSRPPAAAQPLRPSPAAPATEPNAVPPADGTRSAAFDEAMTDQLAAHSAAVPPDTARLRYIQLPPGQTLIVPLTDARGHSAGRYYFHGPDTLAPLLPLPLLAPLRPLSGLAPDTPTLRRLGIRLKPSGIYYRQNISGGGLLDLAYERGHLLFGHNRLSANTPRTAVFPLFITDPTGRELLRYQLPGETDRKSQPAYFAHTLDRLTPVVVPVPGHSAQTLLFWYEVTPALLAALPPPTANEVWCTYRPFLTAETLALATPSAPSATVGAPAATITPCAPSADGSAEPDSAEPTWSLFPNPAHEAFDISLSAPRRHALHVRLLDMAGREVRPRTPADALGAGAQHLRVALDDLPPGLYLVRLEQPGGQHWSRRLLVE